MRGRIIVCAAVVTVGACGDALLQPPIVDAPVDGDVSQFAGGSIEVPDCGYIVTTRFGAEAPRPGIVQSGTDPRPFHVHLGIPGDPRNSIAVQWRTRDEETLTTTMRYAVGAGVAADDLDHSLDGFTFAYESVGDEHPRVHEVHLCGLEPDTEYSYQVGGSGVWSPVYSFRTAPDVEASPDAVIRFAVVGDTRGGYDVFAQLVALLLARQPDVVLFTGDAVTVGTEQLEWELFFARAEPLFARVPVVAANGNHDVNAVHFYSQFANKGDEENFGFDYGWAHVTVLNDSPEIVEDLEARIQPALAADLEASAGARWKLAMHHLAMWSAGQTHGNNLRTQAAFMPLYDQYDVDLVLNGHEHDFELSKPLAWDATAGAGVVVGSVAEGTVFEVQGGGGAPLHVNGTGFWTEYSESVHAATIVTVRRDQMTLEAFRVDGSTIPAGYSETK